MYAEIFLGIIIPFIGTAAGAFCVFFMRKGLNRSFKIIISGFAGGVMIAASVWSLLIPAIEYSSSFSLGMFSFLPAVGGLWLGLLFLLLFDKLLPEPPFDMGLSGTRESRMLFLSVSLHNLPEGMAVGVVYAALLSSESLEGLSGAFALSLGIAVQNFPEGAIISLPLANEGVKKSKAFLLGVLSGVIEPLGGILTLLALSLVLPILPVLLGFAAGAMIYAVIKELMPIITLDSENNAGLLSFTSGFSVMMILDIVLG